MCAAIPFAKGMYKIDVSDDQPGVVCKLVMRQIFQIVLFFEPGMNIVHAHFDPVLRQKPIAALVKIDLAQFTSPVINILKQMQVRMS